METCGQPFHRDGAAPLPGTPSVAQGEQCPRGLGSGTALRTVHFTCINNMLPMSPKSCEVSKPISVLSNDPQNPLGSRGETEALRQKVTSFES